MNRHRLIQTILLTLFAISASAAVLLQIANSTIDRERQADEPINAESSKNQAVSFQAYQGEYSVCHEDVGAPYSISATPAAAPSDATAPPALPKSIVIGDVQQLTIVFVCSFNTGSGSIDPEISRMRDNQVQFKPVLSAVDFDVDGVLTDELSGRDFYCLASPTDTVCKNNSTTPVPDLKWVWFLRPKSVGRHVVYVEIYERKIVAPNQYAEVEPRRVMRFAGDVRQPFVDSIGQLSPVIAVMSAIVSAAAFLWRWLRTRGQKSPAAASAK